MSLDFRIGSLFSGIGGLELGLEWAGVGHTVWQVEREPFAQAVLAKHWPRALRFDDVCTVGAHNLPPVDVICGGFPCQDLSVAGKAAGIQEGTRSGLWFEYARLVRELRPRYVVVENVAVLLARGIDRVLGDLASLGYAAEWSVVSACAVGASHTRERLFVVAYPNALDGAARLRHLFPGRHQVQRHGDRELSRPRPRAWMEDPSALYGGADGVPDRVDRNQSLGNAVAPAVAEVVGRVIVERERALYGEAAA